MLVIDANILIRAVLGSRVVSLLVQYAGRVEFLAPDTAFQEAREHLPGILEKRHIPLEPVLALLQNVTGLVRIVEPAIYSDFETSARQRMDHRDEDDWPILAAALALKCPIWSEDTDFFGCGLATWTTDRVELFLEETSLLALAVACWRAKSFKLTAGAGRGGWFECASPDNCRIMQPWHLARRE